MIEIFLDFTHFAKIQNEIEKSQSDYRKSWDYEPAKRKANSKETVTFNRGEKSWCAFTPTQRSFENQSFDQSSGSKPKDEHKTTKIAS